jgi:hypothetical protein
MKPLLMLSLPNSGSTWLGEVIAESLGLRYFAEYFNPLRNPDHEEVLCRNFGCELATCYQNIASPGDHNIDSDIRGTWFTEEHEFTKEVFSPFKLEAFSRHFECFALLRRPELVFPPTRLRIWSFYEHAWVALHTRNGLAARTCRERAREAHAVLAQQIRDDARRLNVPLIEYDDLFGCRATVERALTRALGPARSRQCVARVLETRRAKLPPGSPGTGPQSDSGHAWE